MKNIIAKTLAKNGFLVTIKDPVYDQLYELVMEVGQRAYNAGYNNGNLDTCLSFSEYWEKFGKEQK